MFDSIVAFASFAWSVIAHFFNPGGDVVALVEGRINLRIINNTTRHIIITHILFVPPKGQAPFKDAYWEATAIAPGDSHLSTIHLANLPSLHLKPKVRGFGSKRSVIITVAPRQTD